MATTRRKALFAVYSDNEPPKPKKMSSSKRSIGSQRRGKVLGDPAAAASSPLAAKETNRVVLQSKQTSVADLFNGKVPFAPASPDVVQKPKAKKEKKPSLFTAAIYEPTPEEVVSEPLPADAPCPTAPRLASCERFPDSPLAGTSEDDGARFFVRPGRNKGPIDENAPPEMELRSVPMERTGMQFRPSKGDGKGKGLVSPLMEVTEAFTGLQGAWGSPLLGSFEEQPEELAPIPSSPAKRPRSGTLSEARSPTDDVASSLASVSISASTSLNSLSGKPVSKRQRRRAAPTPAHGKGGMRI